MFESNDRPFWLQQPCPPWCDRVHDEDEAPADRVHMSAWRQQVPLTTSDVEGREVGGRWRPFSAEWCVQLVQWYRETEPRVILGPEYADYSLTVGEARQLADALTTAADVAEGHANPVS